VFTARYGLNTNTTQVKFSSHLTEKIDPLKPSGYYMHHRVWYSTILRSVHTVYLCVLCGSENKQRLFPYTALTDWFL